MAFLIGTSGWSYPWNRDKSLKWYRDHTGFNAVELNYSFYRLPTVKAVKEWSRFSDLSWSVKANRFITQNLKLNDKSDEYIVDFINVFKKGGLVPDNLLFQLPPSFTFENVSRILRIGKKFRRYNPVFEVRHRSFFNEEAIKTFKREGITLASTDSPFGMFYVNTSGRVYLRFHGRKTGTTTGIHGVSLQP